LPNQKSTLTENLYFFGQKMQIFRHEENLFCDSLVFSEECLPQTFKKILVVQQKN
jgi:hypothetical protein